MGSLGAIGRLGDPVDRVFYQRHIYIYREREMERKREREKEKEKAANHDDRHKLFQVLAPQPTHPEITYPKRAKPTLRIRTHS